MCVYPFTYHDYAWEQGIGKNTTDEDFEELVKVVDYTGDGDVGFDEFVAMLAGDLTSTQVFMHVQIQVHSDYARTYNVVLTL